MRGILSFLLLLWVDSAQAIREIPPPQAIASPHGDQVTKERASDATQSTRIVREVTIVHETPLRPRRDWPYASGHGLVWMFGDLSSVGVGYRKHFENRLGIQVGGGAIGVSDHAWANLGMNMMVSFLRERVIRMYGLIGVSGLYEWEGIYRDSPLGPHHGRLTTGMGIGIEFHARDAFGVIFDLPVTMNLKLDKDGIDSSYLSILPFPSVAFVAYF